MKYSLIACFVFTALISKAQSVDDTTAIKQLLEKESATWRSGDVQGHADCWLVQPYSKFIVSTTDGRCFDIPPETMIHPPANMVGQGGSFANSNYTFKVYGNNGWVCYDEVSTAKDGTSTYSHEIKMLEKVNNDWKIVASSIHLYKP